MATTHAGATHRDAADSNTNLIGDGLMLIEYGPLMDYSDMPVDLAVYRIVLKSLMDGRR
jgi:hypothetical protein